MEIQYHIENFRKVDGITWQEKLDNLSRCNCCYRHQINKPRIFHTLIDTPFSFNQNNTCNCNCRHVARFICRQTDDYSGPHIRITDRPPTPTSVIR